VIGSLKYIYIYIYNLHGSFMFPITLSGLFCQ
jgi:hypothetical protein